MYLSYAEYTAMGGTLDSVTFARLSFKADMMIDDASFGRCQDIFPIPDEIKELVFQLVKISETDDKGGALASVSNDGYSESYAVVNNEQKAKSLLYYYLSNLKDAKGVPVLYKGVEGS